MEPALTEQELRLRDVLFDKARLFNQPSFISGDPVSVPHRFTQKQDIEISGFFAAILAWGNRTTIINSTNRLMALMDHAPGQFILQHEKTDLRRMLGFVHRTFNATDLLYFIHWLQCHYRQSDSLEAAFIPDESIPAGIPAKRALIHFHQYFFSPEHPARTQKHIATPARKSACKRLNMFLRWMVRKDDAGVDFGIWHCLSMKDLICPLDVHVSRIAHRLDLLPDIKANWQQAVSLTERLRRMHPEDPVLFDYALFGLGITDKR